MPGSGRGWWTTIALLFAVVSCGGGTPRPEREPAAPAHAGWPLDGFLHYLPAEWATVLRLPSADGVAASPEEVAALLRQWGLPAADPGALLFRVPEPEGLDRAQGVGLAMDASGSWSHYLPAADKGTLNQSLRGRADGGVFREEGSWIVLSERPPRGEAESGEPLPPGDAAFRVRYHVLLQELADHGDQLTGAVTLGGAGLEVRARLVPGEQSATRAALADARPAAVPGLLDYLPGSAGLRLETTLPPAVLASLVTRRVGVHAGIPEESDRVLLERLLRELLTGIDPDTGLALGVEFVAGDLTVVVAGRVAEGPPSPVLENLQRDERLSYGALVLDPREGAPDLVAKGAWVIGAEPQPDGCPASAIGVVVGLAGGETAPLPVAWKGEGEWFVLAAGPRADHLVRATLIRLTRAGASRGEAGIQLQTLRERAENAGGPYVLGFVAEAAALEHLDPGDARGLRGMFGMRADAPAPALLAVAGFVDEGALLLDARLLYGG